MRKVVVLLAVFAMQACLPEQSSITLDAAPVELHQRSECERTTVEFCDTLPSAYSGAVERAAEAWSTASGVDITISCGAGSIPIVDESLPGDLGGEAQPSRVVIDIDKIVDREVSVSLVIAHEMGHAIGAEHVENDSCLMHHSMAVQSSMICTQTQASLRKLWSCDE